MSDRERIKQLTAKNARLRSLVEFTTPGLFVLRNILKGAGLKLGEAKANEMIAETQQVLASLETMP